MKLVSAAGSEEAGAGFHGPLARCLPLPPGVAGPLPADLAMLCNSLWGLHEW